MALSETAENASNLDELQVTGFSLGDAHLHQFHLPRGKVR